jgi:hypothetical protein
MKLNFKSFNVSEEIFDIQRIGFCTFLLPGGDSLIQEIYNCNSCKLINICQTCVEKCHCDHETIRVDVGVLNCECVI